MKWENFAEVPELIRKYGIKSAYLRIYYHFMYHYIRKLNPLWKLNYNRKNERGSEIMYEDWDFLILLDALRFDVFRDFHKLEGRLESIISLGAGSWEFMCENFEGQQFHDTIYVTANAFAERLEDGIFYKQISVIDQWDEDIGTVHPSSVIEIAKELAGKHPNKRLIIHMMQPHDPHLGELRNKIGKVMSEKNSDNKIMFKACKMQIITRQELIHSYIQNFLFVQDYLDSLIKSLDGKIVISADHGENLGERKFGVRVWEHSIHTRECRVVPWFVIEANSRKKLVEERPERSIRLDETIVNQRLAELGYL